MARHHMAQADPDSTAPAAGELAGSIGVGRAAEPFGVHHRTLREAWDAYGIEVEPPGGGRRRRPRQGA